MSRPRGRVAVARLAFHRGEGIEAVGQSSARPLAWVDHHPIFQGNQHVQIL
jgi:hypothetical protein